MSFFQALVLGILQGFTEFFPVSSSAHLQLAEKLLDLPHSKNLLFFDLSCHVGTIAALVIYARKDLFAFFKTISNWKWVIIAIFPLVPMYFLKLHHFFRSEIWTGVFLVFTGLLLFLSSRLTQSDSEKSYRKKDVLLIGCMQAVSLFPGISRSGSTIAMACFRGWSLKQAIQFSFFLSVPTILGGCVLEMIKSMNSSQASLINLDWHLYATAVTSSFVVGSFAVRIIFAMRSIRKLRRFAWYCLALGALSMLYGSYAN